MEELKIVYIDPRELTPYEGNARKHGVEDIGEIVRSIETDGFNDPIGVWGENNLIVEGHGRQLAALQLGLESVPCIRLDHLTDTQRRDYAIRHNRTAELSEWDEAKKQIELEALEMEGFDVGDLFESQGEQEQAEIKEDEAPEPPEKPRTMLGDIYQLGNHRLICGDSTDHAVIDRLMDGVKAKLLLTDPPYGINVVCHNTRKIGGDKPVTIGKVHGNAKNAIIQQCKEYAPVIGDDTTDTARASYDVAITCTENQIIFGGNYFTDFLPPSRCWIVWDKQNSGTFADAELAWTSFDKVVKLYHFLWNGLCREGSREVEGKTRVHPTQKPVGMLADILKDFSEDNDTILDLFGGSGSTLIACEQLNRRCFMAELDPHYCDVIIDRWEKFTGGKAVLIDG